MNISNYLTRIGYNGSRDPSLNTLHGLQKAHLYAVPFENLSIHTGERVSLNPDWLYRKIVERERGGFCYELNGLFADLLEALGFQVTRLSARVRSAEKEDFGPEFDHLVLRVDLEEPWLADVGFGRSFMEPLRLDIREDQIQPEGSYRITEQNGEFTYWRFENDWRQEYRFTNTARRMTDFETMCRYHQTSRDSSFTARWFATRPHPGGRETLVQENEDFRLVSTSGQERRERTIVGFENAEILLEELFGLKSILPGGRNRKRGPRS